MLREIKKEVLLLIGSLFFLRCSFPTLDWWPLAWAALIPFFLVLDGKGRKAAFIRGYVFGWLFFLSTLYWFIHVTLPGMLLLVSYLAVYFGLFGSGYAALAKKPLMLRLAGLPSLWVALEYIRGHLMSGFGWVALGHSQYKNLLFIQIADVTGVAGVSFLVVMVNLFLKELFFFKPKKLFFPAVLAAGILLACCGYGLYRLSQPDPPAQIKVTVIQGNIPLKLTWDSSQRASIIGKQMVLTRKAMEEESDLVLWSETAFPGTLAETPELLAGLQSFVRGIHTPLLFGVVRRFGENYFNSAVLLSKGGEIIEAHDKIHLVPFGEYVPLRRQLPFLADILQIDDFTPGKRHTIFHLSDKEPSKRPEARMAVLICFEDTLAELTRGFVREGANLLVNITNDAWFKDTPEPYMHLAAAVFRTVENRRALVRAANTGVSCFISPKGKIFKYLEGPALYHDGIGPALHHKGTGPALHHKGTGPALHHKGTGPGRKKTYVPGFARAPVSLNTHQTFYTKLGDIFTYLCFGCILGVVFGKNREGRA